jgi:hypothetical protein
MAVAPSTCLNCGEPLTGKFCSQCGQRALPPYPTVREMIGDAWEELVGWDGRLALTFRMLVKRPGALTLDSLEGRRTRYVKPLRLYLLASVVYFFARLAIPEIGLVGRQTANLPGGDQVTIDLSGPGGIASISPEDRQELLKSAERAPWFLKDLIIEIATDPLDFRRRIIEYMPRAFFVLVPAFAGVLSLVFWRRRFMQHLIFALHLHTVFFFTLTLGELPKLTGQLVLVAAVQIAAWLWLIGYTLISLKRVYGNRWMTTILKSVALAALYLALWVPAMVALLAWAVVMK